MKWMLLPLLWSDFFYLADDYIALGTPKEDYLIVPRSPSINYNKLFDIVRATGLDEITLVS